MKHNERIVDHNFSHKKHKKYGVPKIWLKVVSSGNYTENVYLVNDSSEILLKVEVGSHGFFSTDDKVTNLEDANLTIYEDVVPGQAVLVDSIDIVYESDFMIFLSLIIATDEHGLIELSTPINKGRIPEQVLIYENSFYNPDISFKQI